MRLAKRIAKWVVRSAWRTRGIRQCTAFGYRLLFTPDTEFPAWPLIMLPRRHWRQEITRYGDFVQLHSATRYLSSCSGSPTVVDVGAHHGVYATLYGRIMQPKGGRVLALEPDPASCRVLEANIDLNHLGETVICDQRAASREGGECQLEQHGTQSRLIAGHRIAGPAVSVRMAPLTQILQERQIVRVDLLQIDVEGAELEVLRGFPWGAVSVGWILVELHPYAWASFGYTGREFEKFLQSHHLRCIDCYLREVDLHDSEYIGPTRLLPSHA